MIKTQPDTSEQPKISDLFVKEVWDFVKKLRTELDPKELHVKVCLRHRSDALLFPVDIEEIYRLVISIERVRS
jgi:hypothetical protein